MMRALRLCAYVLLLQLLPLKAHSQPRPRKEVRAVWLTTLQGLDWPAASEQGNIVRQKASLVDILDNIQRLHLNTVIFQVRSRGNAFYASRLEPWAAELTGSFGRDPGWDPLQFAIEECRKRGLSIHAWINVFKVWSGEGTPPSCTPSHIMRLHPEWIRKYGTDQWIDPGIPAARNYLVDVCTDIAARYDLDAIHLDYTRYPEADFTDEATYRSFGNGRNKAEWRRENVNAFVRELSVRVAAVKPKMLIGAAPIGIYKSLPTARGWQGYEALGQDSRRWLSEGWADYVAPQVYWGLKSRGSTIDFEALVRDWADNSAGRQVYAGTAPYKPDVKKWLGEIIDAARNEGADGQVFFRYEHVRSADAFQGRYASVALSPPIAWRDDTRPNPPRDLLIQGGAIGRTISWQPPVRAIDGDAADAYAVYRFPSQSSAASETAELVAVLPATATRYHDPQYGDYRYGVTSLDRLHNESAMLTFPTISADRPLPVAAPSIVQSAATISEPEVTENGQLILLAYSVPSSQDVRIRLMDENGAEVMILVDERSDPGTYVIGIEKNKLPEHIERYVFEAGRSRILRNFSVE